MCGGDTLDSGGVHGATGLQAGPVAADDGLQTTTKSGKVHVKNFISIFSNLLFPKINGQIKILQRVKYMSDP